jgi:molybdenum cofactor guanylyltransferase
MSGRVAFAIIAGGQAERLGGYPKGLLLVGGRRIVDRQINAARGVFSRMLLVSNEPTLWSGLGIPVVGDRVPGAGPLAGIDAALAALLPEEEAVVCVAGDMPFLTPGSLSLLRDVHPHAAAFAARADGRPEPLFARYARPCAPALAAALAAGRLGAASFLAAIGAAYLDETAMRARSPELTFLTNINTPADLARAQGLAGRIPWS